MKLKSFAMLAVSGLLAGSIAYIAPAMADYTNNNNPSMQNNSGNAPSQNMLDPNNNVGSMPNSNQNNSNNPNNNYNNNSADNTNTNANTNTDPNNEQGSPDTATGDDDY